MRRPSELLRACAPALLAGLLCGAAGTDGASPSSILQGPAGALVMEPVHDVAPPWICSFLSDCLDDYLAFPTLALEHAALISEDELDAAFARTASPDLTMASGPVSPAHLGAVVRDALHVEFLLDGWEDRSLDVLRVTVHDDGAVREERLVFHDPFVGAFTVRLLAPSGVDVGRSDRPGPGLPGIVMLPGHLDTADTFLADYEGAAFPAAGYVVIVVEPRADDSGPVEDTVSRYLLVNGFTFMGLRVYEALLAVRFLRAMPAVDPTRIGLLGHSGGSAVVNTLVRLDPPVAAAVTDAHAEYYNIANGQSVLCETVLDLVPWFRLLSDPSTAPMPMKRVAYGWPEGAWTVLRFFDRHLGPAP